MKIYIETLGCPKNENDSSLFGGILQSQGHKIIFNPQRADVIIVNTCGFINDAKRNPLLLFLKWRLSNDRVPCW